MVLSGNSSISQASKKRIRCFQCQINVRPEQKQHEQVVFFNFSNKKWTLQPRFPRYSIWVLNSHGFQHKLEPLMPSRTDFPPVLKALYPGRDYRWWEAREDAAAPPCFVLGCTGTYHLEGTEWSGTLLLSANRSLQLFRKSGKFLLNVNMSAVWYTDWISDNHRQNWHKTSFAHRIVGFLETRTLLENLNLDQNVT